MDEIIKWVKIVVHRTMREKNLLHLDAETLVSAGLLGYSQARSRFDSTRGVKFKTFAEYRIKGAVLDEVRKLIGDERTKNRRPRQVEINFVSMGDDGSHQESMDSALFVGEFWKTVPLTDEEKRILKCRVSGLNLKEIGKLLGFSESRASQVLANIKRQIIPWMKINMGADFKLVHHICPSCQHKNEALERAARFECESCEAEVQIKSGELIVEQLEQWDASEKGNDDGYS